MSRTTQSYKADRVRLWSAFLVSFLLLGSGVVLGLGMELGYAADDQTDPPILHAPQGPDWVADELLIQPKAGLPEKALEALLAQHGAQIKERIPQVNLIVIHVPAERLDTIAQALSHSPAIKSVGKNVLRYLQTTTPNDYWYPGEWHLQKIQAPLAWDMTTGEANTVIAILDSGVAAVSDLSSKLLPGANIIAGGTDTTDDNGHGTAVAGVAAAVTDNSVGVASIAWLNNILPVKIYTSTGTTTCSAVTSGITWAADQGAKVINMSFGGPSACNGEESAVDYAYNKGSVLVAAAGNDASTTPNYPAAYTNVLGVDASNPDDTIASFSNYGNWLSVAAPGNNIVTTYSNGSYAGFAGTSAAAPVVSGIAGLVLSANPALSNSQVQSIIEQNADDLGAPGFDIYYGWGRVNAYRAVLAAKGTTPPPADTQAPSAVITVPTDGATLAGMVTVGVSASDNVAVQSVALLVDGKALATDLSSPYSFIWDTTAVSAGNHTLQAQATDTSGNVGSSASITVMVQNVVDATPPSVTMTNPADGATISGTVSLSATASDNVGVSRVDFYADGGLLGSSNASPYSLNWNTLLATNGSHTLLAKASDAAGNVGTSATVTVTVNNVADATPPVVTITSPANGTTLPSKSSVTVSATASDASGISQLTLAIDSKLVKTCRAVTTCSYSWAMSKVTKGTHTISATAKDNASPSPNTANTAIMVTKP